MEKTEKDNHVLDELVDKIKNIREIKKLDAKILIDTDDKLRDDITLKNIVILIMCVTKNWDIFYPKLRYEEALVT